MTRNRLELIGNAVILTCVLLVLIVAATLQLSLYELPCPLCLLQRLGFFGMACGFLMNLRLGCRNSHYAVVLLSAFYTMVVSLRQVALHVLPGTGGYGYPFLGWHLYTWVYFLSMLVLFGVAGLLMLDNTQDESIKQKEFMPVMTHLFFVVTSLLLILNIILILLECGIYTCPANPTHYL